MRRQQEISKHAMRGILYVTLVILFMYPSVLGSSDIPEQEKIKEEGEKNQLLALPIVYYTPETRIAFGLGGIYYLRSLKDKAKGHPSTLLMDIIYTQEKQFIAEITPDLYLKDGQFHLMGYLGFKNYVENFYGIGSQTLDEMREAYRFKSFKLMCSLRKRFASSLYVGIQLDLEHSKITGMKPGGVLDTSDLLGKDGGIISGVGILLVQDSRDSLFFPTKGTLLQADALMFSPTLASDYKFLKFALDFRQYITVFAEHVLAFQQSIQATSGDVPFQRLPKLGGQNIMRGFIEGRFRDKKAIFFQAEYRIPLVWRLSAAGFIGYGSVADKLSSFKLKDFKISGGVGIRLQVNRKSGTNVRLDFGFAKGNFGVYAMINEAF